jgi:hypothetical protein
MPTERLLVALGFESSAKKRVGALVWKWPKIRETLSDFPIGRLYKLEKLRLCQLPHLCIDIHAFTRLGLSP